MPSNLIALDFDGVLCESKSFLVDTYDFENLSQADYDRINEINDPPVPGAVERLVEYLEDDRLRVAVFSCRNVQPGGVDAMKRWLMRHGIEPHMISEIDFPTEKPQARMIVDDRSWPPYRGGILPTPDEVLAFEPWWKCRKETDE